MSFIDLLKEIKKFLLSDINKKCCILKTNDPSEKIILRMDFDTDKLEIEILENCSFVEYIERTNKYNLEIPIRLILLDSSNFLVANFLEQKIIKLGDYTFTVGEEKMIIDEMLKTKSEIIEIELLINKITKECKITRYIHNFNYSTKSIKSFSSNSKKDVFKCFKLEESKASELIKILLNDLLEVEAIEEILGMSIADIYRIVNLEEFENINGILKKDVGHSYKL